MSHKTEVGIIIPNLEDLVCINCKVNPESANMQDTIIKSLFHCQILTCRIIIYSIRCCIAAPSIQNIGDMIHVIVSKKFYFTGKFQEHLRDLNINFSDPEPVHSRVYVACLKYTFTFRIAPYWNLVGKSFYLKGHNFLYLGNGIDALEWNIIYKHDNSKLELKPMKINLFPLTLAKLISTPSILDNFMTNPKCTMNSIDLTLFQCPSVYVLPLLTKARPVSVSRILPESCPFESYNDLRRHWKNMYAYRLPKSDQGMLFYEVIFPIYPNQRFTYPQICLFTEKPEILMCENKNELASTFIKDLLANVHSVCGHVLKIGNLYPELSVEYSYSFKRKRDSHSDTNQLQSSFFTTATDPPFTRTSNDNIIKPSNEKLNFSSLFTFKGADKMNTSMKNHTQHVLSIMESQNKKQKPVTEKNIKCATSMNRRDTKSYLRSSSQSTIKDSSFVNLEKDIFDTIDAIVSYHDIPSMAVTEADSDENILNNEEIQNSLELCLKQATENLTNSLPHNSLLNQKPIIKNVENVCFDLTRLKKMEITRDVDRPKCDKQNSKQLSENHGNQNFFGEANYDIQSTSNSYCKTQMQDFSTYNFNDQKQLGINELQPPKSVINSDNILQTGKSSQKSKINDEYKSQNNDAETKNQFRALLSNFDSYNIHNINVDNIEDKIRNQIQNSPSFNLSKKFDERMSPPEYKASEHEQNFLESKELQRKVSVQEDKVQQFDKNIPNKLEYEHHDSKNDCSLYDNETRCPDEIESSSSMLTLNKTSKANTSDRKQDDEKIDKCNIFKKETSLRTSPISTFSSNNKNQNMQESKKFVHAYQDAAEENLCYELQYSPSIYDKHEKQSKKLSQKSNQFDQSFESYNLNTSNKSFYKTRLSKSINNSNDKLEDAHISGNSIQYSSVIFGSYDEMQKRKLFNNYELDNCEYQNVEVENQSQHLASDAQHDISDFMSVLSESSNESESGNYKCYKQACAEALTFEEF